MFWTDPLEKGAQTGIITSTSRQRERREPGPARPDNNNNNTRWEGGELELKQR